MQHVAEPLPEGEGVLVDVPSGVAEPCLQPAMGDPSAVFLVVAPLTRPFPTGSGVEDAVARLVA